MGAIGAPPIYRGHGPLLRFQELQRCRAGRARRFAQARPTTAATGRPTSLHGDSNDLRGAAWLWPL
jgi:hypothetical protein